MHFSLFQYTLGYATTNECYNEQILIRCYNEHRCYNVRGGISADVAHACAWHVRLQFFTRERLFMLFMCVRLFMLFQFPCIKVKQLNFILFYNFAVTLARITLNTYRVILSLEAPSFLKTELSHKTFGHPDHFQHRLSAGSVLHRSRYVYINFQVIISIT
jgi:hypothetical protein